MHAMTGQMASDIRRPMTPPAASDPATAPTGPAAPVGLRPERLRVLLGLDPD